MKTYKELKELLEGMNRNMIASFENPDDPEFNFDIYKIGVRNSKTKPKNLFLFAFKSLNLYLSHI